MSALSDNHDYHLYTAILLRDDTYATSRVHHRLQTSFNILEQCFNIKKKSVILNI